MGKHKDFYDKPLYTIPNYIFWFLLGGLYFLLCNILLIFFFFLTYNNPNNFNMFLLFLCLIPLGPSIGALYSSVGVIIREKQISFTPYFFTSYKENFLSNLKLWLIELTTLLIVFMDFQYFYLNMPKKGIHIIFLALGIYAFIIGLYAFPINSRFDLKIKDLILVSLYYSIKKLHVTILKVVVTAILAYSSLKIPPLFITFLPVIHCFLLSYYDKPILLELESKYSPT